MAHTIVVQQQGTGAGGNAVSEVKYTPDHTVPPVLQIRRAHKIERVLQRLHEYLYAGGPDPYPEED